MVKTIVRDMPFYKYTFAKFENGEMVSTRDETRMSKIGARELSKLSQNGEAVINVETVIERREMALEKFYEMSEPARKPKRIYKKRG